MWVILALASAFLLGIYEVFKKLSVQRNAVIPVLFLSTLTSSLIFIPFFIVAATFIGAASGLYDKFIMRRVDRLAVQAWFSFYQVAILLPILAVNRWRLPKAERTSFQWRWSIPLIGVFLVLADFLYFNALTYEDSLISIISSLRRGGVVISFIVGALVFHEKNLRKKGLYLAGILIGILLISLGSH